VTQPGDTIPHRLISQASRHPSAIAYQSKVDGRWQPTTWHTYAEQARTAARALIALGLPRHGKVAILGFNRPEWNILAHAAMMAGGAAAGIYTTCSAPEVQYIVHHSEAHVVLVEDAGQLAKITQLRDRMPLVRHVVMMRGGTGAGAMPWDDFVAHGAAAHDQELEARLASLEATANACLIYTSGTTGPPKAVMLTHDNLAWTSRVLSDVLGGYVADDTMLSYLPLSHIAEQMLSLHLAATNGNTVYFAESLDKLVDNVREARPTIFFSVPRIWEKMHTGIAAKLAAETGARRRLIGWARGVCTRVHTLLDRGEPVPRVLHAQHALAQRLVMTKLKAAIGLDRARVLVSGAAPIAPEVLAFFASLDLPIREVYGQSEDSGPTSINQPGKTKLGTVGPPLPGLEVKIAADGEVLVRGRNVFAGYFKDPDATAEALHDGWLCSGDLGELDAAGFLTITGRKKEIIITAGGKNITPKNIEAAIKQLPLVSEAVVIGDRRRFLTALITLDVATASQLVPGAGEAQLATAPDIRAAIQRQIDEVNVSLARVEQIKKFTVLDRQLAVETGELTPTLKIKRKVVAERFHREIDAMYTEGEP
jgi:long-chain acyl-CoA synthetase